MCTYAHDLLLSVQFGAQAEQVYNTPQLAIRVLWPPGPWSREGGISRAKFQVKGCAAACMLTS